MTHYREIIISDNANYDIYLKRFLREKLTYKGSKIMKIHSHKWLKSSYKKHFVEQTVKFVFAFLKHFETPEVLKSRGLRHRPMRCLVVFANSGGLRLLLFYTIL